MWDTSGPVAEVAPELHTVCWAMWLNPIPVRFFQRAGVSKALEAERKGSG